MRILNLERHPLWYRDTPSPESYLDVQTRHVFACVSSLEGLGIGYITLNPQSPSPIRATVRANLHVVVAG